MSFQIGIKQKSNKPIKYKNMARPKSDNRYQFICKVTGKTIKTNPKQFADLANRYGITPEELDDSYVSREGRHVIATAGLTPEQAVEQYKMHINVANNLKCTVKPKPEKVAKIKAKPMVAQEVTNGEPVAVENVSTEIVTESEIGVSISEESETLAEISA